MVSPAPSEPDPDASADVAASRRATLSLRAVFSLIGINILWGGSSVAAKAALVHIPPMSLAFARFSLAALLLYALASALRVDLRVARRDWGVFWAMGALGLALTYLLTYIGLRHTTAADAALLHAAEPVFLAVLSVLLLRERLRWGKVGGIAAGLVGVFLIVSRGGRLFHLSGAVLGDLLIAGGLIFEALSTVVGKRLVSRYPALTVLAYQMMTGAILLAPFAVVEGLQARWRFDPLTGPTVWSLVYLVLPCTVLGYAAWFLLLNAYAASDLSVFLFVQPVVGAVLGVVLQHDPLTRATLTGAALVLLGMALIHRPWLLEAPPPPA